VRDELRDLPRRAGRHCRVETDVAGIRRELASGELDRGEVLVERERSAHCVASSIAASTSGPGVQVPASTLALICSGDAAPAITEAAVGCAASPPIARCSSVTPASAATFSSASTLSKLRSLRKRGAIGLPLPRRAPSGPSSPRLYLPVSRPLASGKYG